MRQLQVVDGNPEQGEVEQISYDIGHYVASECSAYTTLMAE
jgi:hypothetical protein